MRTRLRKERVLDDRLTPIEGHLVERYNEVLKGLIGKQTELESFRIDKRGESIELEEELGENYLQNGPANRYAIIVNPDQARSDLLHEEFSFDNKILDIVFSNYLQPIDVVTRVEGLFGELHDTVRHFAAIDDLLSVRNINLSLVTPGGFIEKSRRLQSSVYDLKQDPELLVRNEGAHVREMLSLVEQVGDIRNIDLPDIRVSLEVNSFYTRLFDGVYIFREDSQDSPIPIHRPSSPREISLIGAIFSEFENPSTETARNTLIYCGEEPKGTRGNTDYIDFKRTRQVLKFLESTGRVLYDPGLVGSRIDRVEDIALIERGYAVTGMQEHERKKALHEIRDDMPREWYELRDIGHGIEDGRSIEDIVPRNGSTIDAMLMSPTAKDSKMTSSILSRFWQHDYGRMLDCCFRDLERMYGEGSDEHRDYIIDVITRTINGEE